LEFHAVGPVNAACVDPKVLQVILEGLLSTEDEFVVAKRFFCFGRPFEEVAVRNLFFILG